MTIYGLTKGVRRVDERELLAEFDGVTIESLPRMVDNDGVMQAAWTRITPGSHGDDSVVRMETSGARYGAHQRWNPETRQREVIPDAPRWNGRVVVYGTARWQPGDVVKVEVWQSVVYGEPRQWWRLIWTATPPVPGRALSWVERDGDDLTWGEIAPEALFVAPVEGGPVDARRTGALVVTDTRPPQRVFAADDDWPQTTEEIE